jgi:hypothetical protein
LKQVLDGATDPGAHMPVNGRSFSVETDMFSGRVEIHLKGLKTSNKEMFAGKKRYFQIACQVGGRPVYWSTGAGQARQGAREAALLAPAARGARYTLSHAALLPHAARS